MKGYHDSNVPKTVTPSSERAALGATAFALWLRAQLREQGVGAGRRTQLNFLSKRLHLSAVVSKLLLSGYVLPDDPLWLKLQQALCAPDQDQRGADE